MVIEPYYAYHVLYWAEIIIPEALLLSRKYVQLVSIIWSSIYTWIWRITRV